MSATTAALMERITYLTRKIDEAKSLGEDAQHYIEELNETTERLRSASSALSDGRMILKG